MFNNSTATPFRSPRHPFLPLSTPFSRSPLLCISQRCLWRLGQMEYTIKSSIITRANVCKQIRLCSGRSFWTTSIQDARLYHKRVVLYTWRTDVYTRWCIFSTFSFFFFVVLIQGTINNYFYATDETILTRPVLMMRPRFFKFPYPRYLFFFFLPLFLSFFKLIYCF